MPGLITRWNAPTHLRAFGCPATGRRPPRGREQTRRDENELLDEGRAHPRREARLRLDHRPPCPVGGGSNLRAGQDDSGRATQHPRPRGSDGLEQEPRASVHERGSRAVRHAHPKAGQYSGHLRPVIPRTYAGNRDAFGTVHARARSQSRLRAKLQRARERPR